ncbi:hypothetical protein [Piscinibacter sp. HJYY11]|uniref:hypothetical protein n=1 Tax=Piscinibacter sp. HJYY11 TaxID=2801333 RepID=UPI00191FF767|nr:hypothetical protein [Piscinibacter sp. HJYY11]MBL0729655.1 hypothetical protein [Piscinibacter sp. HJYY11]
MTTPESIHRLLTVATSLIDQAAGEIRDSKLEPVRENIEHIGRAIAELFEIQQQIYRLQPDLMPDYLKQPSEYSEANRLLTEYMYNASEFEIAGNHERAIQTLQEFLGLESSELHRNIAEGEIKRLQGAAGA